MILLDTNVLSALMRSTPDQTVVDWLDTQPAESIWLTAITVFEARFGLALLQEGKRRHDLGARFAALLSVDLQNRVLPFDPAAAAQAAELAARRQQAGRPIDMRDTFIAGIALTHKASIATRNTRHFADLSVTVVNPWDTTA